MIDDKEIGRRLRDRRMDLEMSQADLAGKLGITANQVSRWETGTRGIVITDLPKVARVLYVPVGYFLDENPDDAKDPNEVTVEPILDAVRVASSKGVITREFVDETARFIKWSADEAARKRGHDQ